MPNYITNVELSQSYFRIVRPFRSLMDNYKSIKRKVAQADANIHEHYAREGSLKNLKVKGIGRKSIQLLELILTEGEERAAQIFIEERRREKRDRETNNFGLDVVKPYRYRPGENNRGW